MLFRSGDDELPVDALVLDRAQLGEDVGRVGGAGTGAGGNRGEETAEGDEALVDRCELGGELREGSNEGFEQAVCAPGVSVGAARVWGEGVPQSSHFARSSFVRPSSRCSTSQSPLSPKPWPPSMMSLSSARRFWKGLRSVSV